MATSWRNGSSVRQVGDSEETREALFGGFGHEGVAGAVVAALMLGAVRIVRALRRAMRKRRSLLDGGPGITQRN